MFVLPRALAPTSTNFGQCATNQLRCSHSSASIIEHGAHGAFRVYHRIAQRDQCTNSVFRRRPFAVGSTDPSRCNNLHLIELVREVEDELLGLLSPDSWDTLQGGNVFLANCANESFGGKSGKHPQSEGGPDPLRVEHTPEDLTLECRREAEQLPAVFLDDKVRVQPH